MQKPADEIELPPEQTVVGDIRVDQRALIEIAARRKELPIEVISDEGRNCQRATISPDGRKVYYSCKSGTDTDHFIYDRWSEDSALLTDYIGEDVEIAGPNAQGTYSLGYVAEPTLFIGVYDGDTRSFFSKASFDLSRVGVGHPRYELSSNGDYVGFVGKTIVVATLRSQVFRGDADDGGMTTVSVIDGMQMGDGWHELCSDHFGRPGSTSISSDGSKMIFCAIRRVYKEAPRPAYIYLADFNQPFSDTNPRRLFEATGTVLLSNDGEYVVVSTTKKLIPQDTDNDSDVYLYNVNRTANEPEWILVSEGLTGSADLASVGKKDGKTRVVYTGWSSSYAVVTDIEQDRVLGHRIIGHVTAAVVNPPKIARSSGDVVVAVDDGKIVKMIIDRFPFLDALF
jgi:hypothetical protein